MYHNKASLQINGECSSVDEAVTKDWHKNVAQIMKQYAVQNTFYMKLHYFIDSKCLQIKILQSLVLCFFASIPLPISLHYFLIYILSFLV